MKIKQLQKSRIASKQDSVLTSVGDVRNSKNSNSRQRFDTATVARDAWAVDKSRVPLRPQ